MARIEGYFEYPDDLTPGRSKDGGIHHNLYDDEGRLVEHGKFVPSPGGNSAPEPVSSVSGQEGEPISDADAAGVLLALVLVGVIAAAQNAPQLKKWWSGRALPALRATARRVLRRDESNALELVPDQPARLGWTGPVGFSTVSMTSAERRERMAAIVLARDFIEEQMAILRDARVETEGQGVLDLAGAIDRLTPDQVAVGIRGALEGDVDPFEDSRVAELGRSLMSALAAGKVLEAASASTVLRLTSREP